MKTQVFFKTLSILSITLLLLLACKPGSIAIKGNDCNMNGGFEILKNNYPVNWNYYSPTTVNQGDFTISSDSLIVKEGRRSLKFNIKQCESIGGWHSPGFFWIDDIRIEGEKDKSERKVYPYRGDEECK